MSSPHHAASIWRSPEPEQGYSLSRPELQSGTGTLIYCAHLHPRTQTCCRCRCRSPSLWAVEECNNIQLDQNLTSHKDRLNTIREPFLNILLCEERAWPLTPLVERATKCLATAEGWEGIRVRLNNAFTTHLFQCMCTESTQQ